MCPPEILNMLPWQRSVSLATLKTEGGLHGWQKELRPAAASSSTIDKRQGERRKKAKPGTAASCSTNDKRQGEKWKRANCSTLLRRITRLKTVNSESDQGSRFLPRKVFPEGLMSSRRIRHESHTCSELPYRIVMWNASGVQKTI